MQVLSKVGKTARGAISRIRGTLSSNGNPKPPRKVLQPVKSQYFCSVPATKGFTRCVPSDPPMSNHKSSRRTTTPRSPIAHRSRPSTPLAVRVRRAFQKEQEAIAAQQQQAFEAKAKSLQKEEFTSHQERLARTKSHQAFCDLQKMGSDLELCVKHLKKAYKQDNLPEFTAVCKAGLDQLLLPALSNLSIIVPGVKGLAVLSWPFNNLIKLHLKFRSPMNLPAEVTSFFEALGRTMETLGLGDILKTEKADLPRKLSTQQVIAAGKAFALKTYGDANMYDPAADPTVEDAIYDPTTAEDDFFRLVCDLADDELPTLMKELMTELTGQRLPSQDLCAALAKVLVAPIQYIESLCPRSGGQQAYDGWVKTCKAWLEEAGDLDFGCLVEDLWWTLIGDGNGGRGRIMSMGGLRG